MFPFAVVNAALRVPIVTAAIILANLAVMIWMSRKPADVQQKFVVQHGFVPQRIKQLTNPKLTVRVAIDQRVKGRYGQMSVHTQRYTLPPRPLDIFTTLFTSLFIHGGWMHLLGNMWFLWLFGDNVEDRLGPWVYAGFYLLGGLIATACHWAYEPNSTLPVIGASGAIAAVLGAYAVTFPYSHVRTVVFLLFYVTVVELPALAVLSLWFVGQMYDAFGPNADRAGIAFWAHIGGFLAGAILMPLICKALPRKHYRWGKDEYDGFSQAAY